MKTLDPEIQEKQDALQLLINGCVFAPSASALAKRLGYKGKTSIYRIQQGEASAGAIEEAWDKLASHIGGNEELLYTAARAVGYAKNFKQLIQSEGQEVKKENRHKWVLLNVMKKDELCFSKDFRHDVWPDLMDLLNEDEEALWMMLLLYYYGEEGVDVYAKDFDLKSTLDELHQLLQRNYDNCDRAKKGISNIFRKDYIDLYCKQCLWDLMYYGYIALMYYANPQALTKTMQAYTLYNLGHDSYWVAPDVTYMQGARLWHLIELQVDEGRHGIYYALELEVGKNKEDYRLKQIVPMVFSDDTGILHIEVSKQRIPITGSFEWGDDYYTLYIKMEKEVRKQYGIPDTLHRIDMLHPQGKEEKIWAFALKEYAKEIPAEIEREIFHFEGIDYLNDDYTIENVTIDRRSLTITLTEKAEKKTSDYCIDIKKYPFLRTLLPSDLISIIRPLNTDEVSFQWVQKGYVIPLKEFTKSAIE
ncbi:MAG: hypothetical protein J6V12_08640 [Bacteroidaceae bacterium]|nr:hypothetical protein [Bacteroidaceae bacterium]